MEWNAQYDVIVLGFGGAGATAARFAADGGAKVLLVDAAPYGHEGGNTRYAHQDVATGTDLTELTTYYQHMYQPYHVADAVLNAYLTGMVNMHDYFKKYLGVQAVSWKHDIKPGDPVPVVKELAEYPELPGHETFDYSLVHHRHQDAGLWKILRQKVVDRADKIDVWLDSRAKHLYFNQERTAIQGVQITRQNKVYNVVAKRGVVLATGGYENNPEMIQTFLQKPKLTPLGTLYNRGDGIRMAQEVGAKLWHMGVYEAFGDLAGLTFSTKPHQRGRQAIDWPLLNHGSIFVIADDGTRFFNEAQPSRHGRTFQHGHWTMPLHNDHPYLIFDQTQYQKFEQQLKADGRLPYPEFMDKIIQGTSLTQLAEKIQVPAENLQNTVNEFSEFTRKQHDYTAGRDTATMRVFDQGPYYAVKLANDVLNTQGGPQRDEQCRVLNLAGQAIGHLFSAGELGGICANRYQGGGNLAECLISGKIAGESAAKATETMPQNRVITTVGAINDLITDEASHFSVGPHQYLGSSNEGIGGKVVVRVTYDHHEIQEVEVLENHESEDVGIAAITQIPKQVVQTNSTDIDVVSGASATSRALKHAIEQAISKAK